MSYDKLKNIYSLTAIAKSVVDSTSFKLHRVPLDFVCFPKDKACDLRFHDGMLTTS